MTDLRELRDAWVRADARLHAHLPHQHRSHLPEEHVARIGAMSAEMGDDILGDPGEIEAAASEARATYDAYVAGMHQLGQGMG